MSRESALVVVLDKLHDLGSHRLAAGWGSDIVRGNIPKGMVVIIGSHGSERCVDGVAGDVANGRLWKGGEQSTAKEDRCSEGKTAVSGLESVRTRGSNLLWVKNRNSGSFPARFPAIFSSPRFDFSHIFVAQDRQPPIFIVRKYVSQFISDHGRRDAKRRNCSAS